MVIVFLKYKTKDNNTKKQKGTSSSQQNKVSDGRKKKKNKYSKKINHVSMQCMYAYLHSLLKKEKRYKYI